MSENLSGPNVSTPDQERFDGTVANIQETARVAAISDEVSGEKFPSNNSLYYESKNYSSKDHLPTLTVGNRRGKPYAGEVTLIAPEDGEPDQISAHVGKEVKTSTKNADTLRGMYRDVGRTEHPGLSVSARSRLTSPENGQSSAASSALEVRGFRRSKRTGEWKSVNKELHSDNPLVARMIADIALKQIREEAGSRINVQRLANDERWKKAAKNQNKRAIWYRASKEDIMREEADADNAKFDKRRNELKKAA